MNQCHQSCLDGIFALFQGDCRCAATAVAIIAFLLGMAAMWVLLRAFCRCGKSRTASSWRMQSNRGEKKPFEKRKPHPAPADGSVEIYVGNLSYDMTEEQLRQAFAAYGAVGSVRLITNRYNGKSKGFGFVQMPNREEAEKAVAALNDKDFMGRRMKCNEAKNLI